MAGRDYDCSRNELAVGGRVLDLRTPQATYEDVWLDLHGGYQGDNFAAALVAAEAFFGAPLDDGLVREAAATVRSPGRLEIVGHDPLVVLDGAKNLEGAERAAAAVARSSAPLADPGRRDAAGQRPRSDVARPWAPGAPVWWWPAPAVAPGSARRRPGRGRCASDSGGGGGLGHRRPPGAFAAAGPDDLILVTGSLYAWAARTALGVRA